MGIELDGIDHVHINVSDRIKSEEWYKSVLGFSRVAKLEFWAKDGGPLTLQNSSSSIHLALFESQVINRTTIAFKVSATALASGIEFLAAKDILVKPVDHEISWSIYFEDPDGNPYEITTYEYELFSSVHTNS